MKRKLIQLIQSIPRAELHNYMLKITGLDCAECGKQSPKILYDFCTPFLYQGTYMCQDCLDKTLQFNLDYLPQITQGRLPLRFQVLMRDGFRCQYCGRSPKNDENVVLEVDHVMPKSKGGGDSFDNLVTACRECNQGKKDILLK